MTDQNQLTKRVLLVEDDEDLRLAMRLRLGQTFQVETAEDGISAMAAAKRSKPDAIILDLGLPGGDGFRVLEWLRESPDLSFVPVIVLTGRDGDGLEEQVREAGATHFLQKPATNEQLQELLDDVTLGPNLQHKRVLVVEDYPDARDALRALLTGHGYSVATASDGATALIAARQHKPDVILLDLGLPGGDGISVLQRLKQIEELASTPVIVVTGKEPEEFLEDAIAAGASGYLEKPAFSLEVLTAIGAVS